MASKKAFFCFGPTGSGKGTLAGILAEVFGVTNFDTGRILEALLHDPASQDDPVILRERALFDGKMLNTPQFVLSEVVLKQARLIAAGSSGGIVYSGSPRTMDEAKVLIPLLEELYGKENMHFFFLDVSPQVAIARNTKRLTCGNCISPIPVQYYASGDPETCPRCQSKLYRREVDVGSAQELEIRLQQFRDRTLPILGYLEDTGHVVHKIDASQESHKVLFDVLMCFEDDLS